MGLWGLLLFLVTIRITLEVTSFTSSIIIISNCVTSRYLGSVNGLGQMVASGFRALGPFLAGCLWSWSLGNGKSFPFNHFFVFILAAFICFLGFLLGLVLPKFLNHPKRAIVGVLLPIEPHGSVQSFEYESTLYGSDVNTSVQSFGSLLFSNESSENDKSPSAVSSF